MSFLIIGFGGMGCRHAQSLLDAKMTDRVYVIEPSDDIFCANLTRIGYSTTEVQRVTMDQVTKDTDVAIVATSSEPRFGIVKQLIHKGIKSLLLEKVVFQSLSQFDEISALAKDNGTAVVGNLPNRYFANYIRLRKHIASNPGAFIRMNVIGGDFGLACNSIHYVDLFKYLTDFDLTDGVGNFSVSELNNRRGQQYKELNGCLTLKDKNGKGELTIISEKNYKGGVVVTLTINDKQTLLFENEQKEYSQLEGAVSMYDFIPTPSSKLTSRMISDLAEGNCLLPDLTEMRECHDLLFRQFNRAFSLPAGPSTICPIT